MVIFVFIASLADEINILTDENVKSQAKRDATVEANRMNLKNIFLLSSCSSCMTSTLMSPFLLIAMIVESVVEDKMDLKIKTDVLIVAIFSILIYTNAQKIANAYMFKYKSEIYDKSKLYQNVFNQEYYLRIKERIKQTSFIGATISLFITICALLTYDIAVND